MLPFKTIELKPRIGTEIVTDVETLLSGDYAGQIRELLEQRGVLVFRGLHLTDEQHLAFSRTLGEVIPQGGTGLVKISLDREETIGADYFKTSFYWHLDGTNDEIPTRASLLSARRLAATGGGQTEVANTYAAYDDLAADEKKAFDRLRVVHSFEVNQRMVNPMPTHAELLKWRSIHPHPRVHPLIWHHTSGRNSLVIGTTTSHVVDMSLEDGRELLCRLLDHATQLQYVYRHEWQVGDLLIWDNTGTLHRAVPYTPDSGRLMQRTTLVGEEELV